MEPGDPESCFNLETWTSVLGISFCVVEGGGGGGGGSGGGREKQKNALLLVRHLLSKGLISYCA